MGIYFSKIRSILEVKRKINGQEEDLENEENDNNTQEEPDTQEGDQGAEDEDDEHQADNSASDYSMEVDDDSEETESQEDNEEPENDENDEHQADNSASDYSMEVDENEDSEEDNGENEGQEDSEDDEHQADNSTSDYSMDNVDDDADNQEQGDDNTEDGSQDNTGDNEIQSLENDLFKDITPEQMNIKILELKKQYLEVYSTITDVLTRTNKIQKTTQNIKVLEFIINKLMELKDIVQFYLSNTFDTKSYMENMVNYQQYLVTLNTINRLLKEINVKKGK